ncbi:unnamed protein product [Prunus armeniaca]|uniref:Pectate lyase superfamily protein domain-containing protein n=1 Tax=Prunus armeniaca TaxID=36596 RepID=A0A6J5TEB6_PRUAR|nr:unnamed protein product [Prunus armeniaca]
MRTNWSFRQSTLSLSSSSSSSYHSGGSTFGLEALRNIVDGFSIFKRVPVRAMPKLRHVAFNLTDFGAVGDGVTLNTEAFEKAVLAISKLGKKGGGQPNMPHGR